MHLENQNDDACINFWYFSLGKHLQPILKAYLMHKPFWNLLIITYMVCHMNTIKHYYMAPEFYS